MPTNDKPAKKNKRKLIKKYRSYDLYEVSGIDNYGIEFSYKECVNTRGEEKIKYTKKEITRMSKRKYEW